MSLQDGATHLTTLPISPENHSAVLKAAAEASQVQGQTTLGAIVSASPPTAARSSPSTTEFLVTTTYIPMQLQMNRQPTSQASTKQPEPDASGESNRQQQRRVAIRWPCSQLALHFEMLPMEGDAENIAASAPPRPLRKGRSATRSAINAAADNGHQAAPATSKRDNIRCNQCNLLFSRMTFNDHISHSNIPHLLTYQCRVDGCVEWFGSLDAVKVHRLTCRPPSPSKTSPLENGTKKRKPSLSSISERYARDKVQRNAPENSPVAPVLSSAPSISVQVTPTGSQRQPVASADAFPEWPAAAAAASPMKTGGHTVPAAAMNAFPASSPTSIKSSMPLPVVSPRDGVFDNLPSQNAALRRRVEDLEAVLDSSKYPSHSVRLLTDIELYLSEQVLRIRREMTRREGCIGPACQMMRPNNPNPRATLSLPCAHVSLCTECVTVVTHCPEPECRQRIMQYASIKLATPSRRHFASQRTSAPSTPAPACSPNSSTVLSPVGPLAQVTALSSLPVPNHLPMASPPRDNLLRHGGATSPPPSREPERTNAAPNAPVSVTSSPSPFTIERERVVNQLPAEMM